MVFVYKGERKMKLAKDVLKFVLIFMTTIFDLFIVVILTMAVTNLLIDPSRDFVVSKPVISTNETNLLVALMFVRLLYVMLVHMGVVSRFGEMLAYLSGFKVLPK